MLSRLAPILAVIVALAGGPVAATAAHPEAAAEALRLEGRRLAAAERYAEAAEAFADAARLAPLDPDPVARLAVLIRLGRMDEARAIAESVVGGRSGTDVLRLVARAMVEAGELGRARMLLDVALAQAPDDAALLVERAGVETAARRPLRAVAYLEEAVRQVPAAPAPLRALVRGLAAAGMPVRAVQAFEAAVKGGMAVDEEMLEAAMSAMQAYGDHRGTIDLADRYGDQVRASAVLSRMAAASLEALGARERAAERLRQVQAPDQARPAGGGALEARQGDVLAGRARELVSAGRWDAAAPVAWEWARTRPDDPGALETLFLPEVAERVGWARVFAQLNDHVERDPEDPDRRLRALKRHVGTGGSAVLALVHAQALERLAGGDDPRHAEGRRLGQDLRRSLESVGRLVDVDFARTRIVLATRDGLLEARFHPVTGRLHRFAVGERWIAARWSPDGLVLDGLSDWKGNVITATRRDGRLVAIEAKGADAFRAELGPDGAPARLAADVGDPVGAYNAAIALLSAWPRTGLAGARWLRIGR